VAADFVLAGLADDRCTLPADALKRLSHEVVHIRSILKARGRGSSLEILGFRDEAVETVPTPCGVIHQFRNVDQPGLGGAINLFNVRFAFELAANPAITPGSITPVLDDNGQPIARESIWQAVR
jgi:hypothetical protein